MRLRVPNRVYFEVTYRCNLDCLHCYLGETCVERNALGKEEVLSILEELASLKVFYVVFGGGEPFVHTHVVEYAAFAAKNKLVPCFTTNGTLLSEQTVQRLAAICPLGTIQISLYAITPEVHDAVVNRRGAHRKVIAGIENALCLGLPVSLATALTRVNHREVGRLMRWGIDRGISVFNVIPLELVGRARDAHVDLTRDEENEVEEVVSEIRSRYKVQVFSRFAKEAECVRIGVERDQLNDVRHECGGNSHCTINPEGLIFPCSLLRESKYAIGDLREQRFEDIWRSSQVLIDFLSKGCPHRPGTESKRGKAVGG